MVKVFATVLLTLLLGQSTGAMSFVAERACRELCPNEESGKSCLPGCSECACCGMLRALPPAPLSAPTVALAPETVRSAPVRRIAAPAPQEIFHVPKSLLV